MDATIRALTPKEVIARIRAEEYLLDVDASDAVKRGVRSLHRKLDKALRLLSDDLYSKKTHFILELVQNADDNEYRSGDVPKLTIRVEPEELIVSNNELGFSAENVQAICSVGESLKTKKGGYIGEKGIGFKSVFTVSDCPQIHSNGYHFKFDARDKNNLLGYVVPHWIEDTRNDGAGGTRIVLPAKQGVLFGDELLSGLDARLLMFLSKLRELKLDISGIAKHYHREDDGDGIVLTEKASAADAGVTRRYIRVVYKVAMNDLQEERREKIQESEVILAFPLAADGHAEPEADCPTYAFLPIRSFGFRFCVQADFLLSASREDVHTDRPWNVRLRDAIADAFIQALPRFKSAQTLGLTYLRYLPTDDAIVDEFFRPVAEQIIEKLKHAECLLGETGEWRKPGQLWRASSEFRKLVPARDALQLFGMDYLHTGYDVDDKVLDALGCKRLTLEKVITLFSEHGEWLKTKGKEWLARFYVYLARRDFDDLKQVGLPSAPCVLTNAGTFAAPTVTTVFYPLTSRKRYGFESELTIIDEELLEDAVSRSDKVRQLFDALDVKVADPYQLITGHILKQHDGEAWKSANRKALVGHLRYIKDKFDEYLKEAEHRGISRDAATQSIRSGIWIGTKDRQDTGTWMFSRGDRLYFSKGYHPSFSIEELLADKLSASSVVSSDYLRATSTKRDEGTIAEDAASWRSFLEQLGVSEAPRVVKAGNGDVLCSEELKLLAAAPESAVRRALLECIDRHWNFYGSSLQYAVKVGRSWEWRSTQFIQTLREMLAPTKRQESAPLRHSYYATKEVLDLLGQAPLYVDAKLENEGLLRACQITYEVDVTACVKRIRQLRDGGKATLPQIQKIYRRLEALCAAHSTEIKAVFAAHRMIFIRGDTPRWLKLEECVWRPTGTFLDSVYQPLQGQYSDFQTFFVKRVGVSSEVPVAKMVAALPKLAEIDDVGKRTEEALRIYRRVARELAYASEEPDWVEDFRSEAIFLDTRGQFVSRDDNLFVNDSPSIATLFSECDDISFLAGPFSELPRLRPLLDAVQVPRLSSELRVEVVEDGAGNVMSSLTTKVRRAIDGIARLLYHRSHREFEAARDAGLFRALQTVEIVQVPNVTLRVYLGDREAETLGEVASSNGRILVRAATRSVIDRIATEISRLLKAPDSFADGVSRLLLAEDSQAAEDYLAVHNISKLPAEERSALSAATSDNPALAQQDLAEEDVVETDSPGEEEPDNSADGVGRTADQEPIPVPAPSSLVPERASSPMTTVTTDVQTLHAGGRQAGREGRADANHQSGHPIEERSVANDASENASNSDVADGGGTAKETPPTDATGGLRGWSSSRPKGAPSRLRSRRKHRAATTKSGRLVSYAEPKAPRDDANVGTAADSELAAVRDKISQAAVAYFMQAEAGAWKSLEEMPRNNPGYDIRAIAHDEEEEFIEVKGQGGAWTERGVILTPTELSLAQRKRERYWLCVVEYATDEHRRQLYLVQDPYGCTQQFLFDSGWKSKAMVRASRPTKPVAGLRIRVEGEGEGDIISVKWQGRFAKVHIHLDDGRQLHKAFNPASMTLSAGW